MIMCGRQIRKHLSDISETSNCKIISSLRTFRTFGNFGFVAERPDHTVRVFEIGKSLFGDRVDSGGAFDVDQINALFEIIAGTGYSLCQQSLQLAWLKGMKLTLPLFGRLMFVISASLASSDPALAAVVVVKDAAA